MRRALWAVLLLLIQLFWYFSFAAESEAAALNTDDEKQIEKIDKLIKQQSGDVLQFLRKRNLFWQQINRQK